MAQGGQVGSFTACDGSQQNGTRSAYGIFSSGDTLAHSAAHHTAGRKTRPEANYSPPLSPSRCAAYPTDIPSTQAIQLVALLYRPAGGCSVCGQNSTTMLLTPFSARCKRWHGNLPRFGSHSTASGTFQVRETSTSDVPNAMRDPNCQELVFLTVTSLGPV